MARPGVVVVGEAVPDAVEAAEASELYPVMVLDVGRCQLMRRLRPVEERNDGVYADAAMPILAPTLSSSAPASMSASALTES